MLGTQARKERSSAVVGRAVGADQAAAVDRKHDRQVLQRDVVDELVVGALKEGRVDRHHRHEALAGQPGGEGDRVLLGDADVEVALGCSCAKRTRPEPSRIAGVMPTSADRPWPCRTASRRTPGCRLLPPPLPAWMPAV